MGLLYMGHIQQGRTITIWWPMHQSMATLLLSLGILILGMEAVKKAFVSSMA